ncbi:hypothetical protein N7528_010085 [Penicillium herquei]|nr:hypothetical protein N7528_010085 [Penicillium herquei]
MSSKDNISSPSPATRAKSAPVNDTTFNRFFTLLAVKLLWSIRPCKGSVLMLTDRLCVKYGPRIHLSEASTMRFISERTSIPVPRVISAFTHGGETYILMERIKGDMIGSMIQEMREISVPEGTEIASSDGGSMFDCRLPGGTLRFGPFDSIQDFHRVYQTAWRIMAFEIYSRRPEQLNILIRGDDIVGIIDWETSGWYPSYWEYTTACQVNPQNSFWIHEIDKFLLPMPEELAMERTRQKYFGDI